MTDPKHSGNPIHVYLAGLLAWLIPGAGHWYLGQRNRGIAIFAAMMTTYLLGLYVGGLELIDPTNARIWYFAQILAGLPTILATILQDSNVKLGVGKGIDVGQVYTGIVGLLNLLCILHILFPTQSSETDDTHS